MTKRTRRMRNRLRDYYPIDIPGVDLAPQVDSLERAYILARHRRRLDIRMGVLIPLPQRKPVRDGIDVHDRHGLIPRWSLLGLVLPASLHGRSIPFNSLAQNMTYLIC